MKNVAKNEEINALSQGIENGTPLEELAVQFNAIIEKMIANLTAYERPRPRVAYAGIKFKRSEYRGMNKDSKRNLRWRVEWCTWRNAKTTMGVRLHTQSDPVQTSLKCQFPLPIYERQSGYLLPQ